ncbi:putative oxalocrotonate tautomerase [Hysterangium stoloniferum]|nr:putative oxalocrotonate tautomerase [Hysterangium stoloniferum]
MPLHRIYTPPGLLSSEEKATISKELTKYYTQSGLPAFYVIVLFIDVEEDNIFVGGEKRNNFVRIVSQQLARTVPPERYQYNLDGLEAAWAPIFKPRGIDWEFHIEQHERGLWRINGFNPPPSRSEGEMIWARENRPVDLSDASS